MTLGSLFWGLFFGRGQGPIVLNSILSTIYSFYYLKYSAPICPQHSLTQNFPEFFEVPKAKTSHPKISQTKNPRTFFSAEKKTSLPQTSAECQILRTTFSTMVELSNILTFVPATLTEEKHLQNNP